MKVLFSAVDSEATGSLRLLNSLRILERKKLLEARALNLLSLDEQLQWADILVMQCLVHPKHLYLIETAQNAGVSVVLDYDDNFAALHHSRLDLLGLSAEEAEQSWKRYLQAADLVTTTCPRLQDEIRSVADIGAWILPNCITEQEYQLGKYHDPHDTDEVRVLYTCSDTHLEDMQWIAPVLGWLGESYSQMTLISHGPLDFKYLFPKYKINHEHLGYVPYSRYQQALLEMSPNICIAPLRNNPQAICRSDIKFWQIAATKAAFLGSDLPPYQESVVDGRNGLLAGGRLSWWWQLRKLIKDPNLRRRLGEQAYRDAENYLIENHAYLWLDAYATTCR